MTPEKTNSMTFRPSVIIFDVDGVLVDVRGSFHSTILETVKFFTGKRVTRAELHRWKNRSGFNDDWILSTAWVQSLGGKFEFEEVKRKFVEIYWGTNGKGNVAREKWLLPPASLSRLSKRAELALFTGRTSRELDYTFDRCRTRKFFKKIVTVENVKQPKPDPEGLLKILAGRNPNVGLYVGDNVDDALAARAAKVSFVGILPASRTEHRERRKLLSEVGAEAILPNINELEVWLRSAKTPAHAKSIPRR
jgi:HAD superfamily phosphatase